MIVKSEQIDVLSLSDYVFSLCVGAKYIYLFIFFKHFIVTRIHYFSGLSKSYL
jgi:hypothetical protein